MALHNLCARLYLTPLTPNTATQIGLVHGSRAKAQVHGTIAFYTRMFAQKCSLSWPDVTAEAEKYVAPLQSHHPRYLDEMRGIAEGAGVSFLDIMAINVRTEIMFGLFTDLPKSATHSIPSDGCTSLGWVDETGRSFIAQNWDWRPAQKKNLIVCHVEQPVTDIPRFSMVTEAGIIGKIGFNAVGVGCLLNAIRARGVDPSKLPVHLALRTILESKSRSEAIATIRKLGVAGSAHIMVGDATGATGLECSAVGVKELEMNGEKRVHHTNHFVLEHPGVEETPWLEDSFQRLPRIQKLADNVIGAKKEAGFEELLEMFKDEQGYPASINRKEDGEGSSETLFTIIADLSARKGLVKYGRPTEGGKEIWMTP